jgi:hypothetical protein
VGKGKSRTEEKIGMLIRKEVDQIDQERRLSWNIER